MENLVCFTEHKESSNLKGQVLVYQYVDSLFGDEVEALIDRLKKEGYQDLKAVTYDEYEELAYAAVTEVYKIDQAQEITESEFLERLNILPPCDYSKIADFTCFRLGEEIDFRLYSYYIQIGSHFFTVVAKYGTNKDKLFKICNACIELKQVA